MDLTRCFIAIEYPQIILDRIIKTRNDLKAIIPDKTVRWVADGNLHLTTKFLGEIAPSVLEEIRSNMRNICSVIQPIQLHIRGMGVFPNFKNPKIIWIGAEESDPLLALARRCDDTCSLSGIMKEDRPFKPHLTIGRISQNASETHQRLISEYFRSTPIPEYGKFVVDHLVLFKSDLQPTGPIYTVIEQFPFI